MKILFVHNHPNSFVRIDQEILSAQHDVHELYVNWRKPRGLIEATIAAIRGVLWCDVVFAWFGGFHALLPFLLAKMLGKHCLVVASGYDVANEPLINYGNMRPGVRRWISRLVFRLADCVLAVSHFTATQAISNARISPSKLQVITHGIPKIPTCTNTNERQMVVLTAAHFSETNLQRKGLIHLTQIARFLPEFAFVIIGQWDSRVAQHLKQQAPPNVILLEAVEYGLLRRFMHTVSIYMQLSFYESFGMALAEAMLAGCLPVVTNRAALPEVVGDIGYQVAYGDIQATVRAIRLAAVSADASAREAAAERIATNFSLDQRRTALLQAVAAVTTRSL